MSVRAVRAAFTFLTRIPLGGFPFTDEEWRWAAAHFPLVGAMIGALLAASWALLRSAGLSALPSAAVVVTLGVISTGAFHEDGLADTADALGGGCTREKILTILKDSRIGAFGATALSTVIPLRIVLLAELVDCALGALLVTHCLARLAPTWLLATLPYVTPVEQSRSLGVARAGFRQAAVATAWALLLLMGLVAHGALDVRQALAAAAATFAVGLLCGHRFRARLGGVTGDLLGATEQIGECIIPLALLLAARAQAS